MYDARKVYFRNQNLTLRFAAELEDFESDDTDSIPAESLAAYARYSKNTVEEEMLKQQGYLLLHQTEVLQVHIMRMLLDLF